MPGDVQVLIEQDFAVGFKATKRRAVSYSVPAIMFDLQVCILKEERNGWKSILKTDTISFQRRVRANLNSFSHTLQVMWEKLLGVILRYNESFHLQKWCQNITKYRWIKISVVKTVIFNKMENYEVYFEFTYLHAVFIVGSIFTYMVDLILGKFIYHLQNISFINKNTELWF